MDLVSAHLSRTKQFSGSKGGEGGVVGVNLGVIVVQVCQPVFRNLLHSYTWPFKKQTPSYTWSSEMMTIHILPFDGWVDSIWIGIILYELVYMNWYKIPIHIESNFPFAYTNKTNTIVFHKLNVIY